MIIEYPFDLIDNIFQSGMGEIVLFAWIGVAGFLAKDLYLNSSLVKALFFLCFIFVSAAYEYESVGSLFLKVDYDESGLELYFKNGRTVRILPDQLVRILSVTKGGGQHYCYLMINVQGDAVYRGVLVPRHKWSCKSDAAVLRKFYGID